MTFIASHPWVFILAIVSGLLVFTQTRRIADMDHRLLFAIEALETHWLWVVAVVAFYFMTYLFRPVFYSGYHGGLLGDNYLFAHHGIRDHNFYFVRHLYFPWVPAQLIYLLQYAGLFSPHDPYFLEKVFTFYSLPNRLAAAVGLYLAYAIFRRMGWRSSQAILGTAWLAVSFGYWFWALQSTALGLITVMMVAMLWSAIRAMQSARIGDYAICGLVTALCIFVHISALYACFGVALGLIVDELLGRRRQSASLAFRKLTAFVIPPALLAILFYGMAKQYYHTSSPSETMAVMSDDKLLGGFTFGKEFLLRTLRDGVGAVMSESIGLIQAGLRQPIEWAACFLQLTVLAYCVFSLCFFNWKDFRTSPLYRIHRLLLITFVTMLIGYGTRKTWLQYYAPLSPIVSMTFAAFAFGSGVENRRRPMAAALGILILATFYINGFSTVRVYEGEKATDHVVYRRLQSLSQQFPGQMVDYFAARESYEYNFSNIRDYYGVGGPLAKIHWREPISIEHLPQVVADSQGIVVVNAEQFPNLQRKALKTITLKEVSLPDVPGGVYVLTRKRA